MGDDGKLYNGITKQTVSLMRQLIAAADYIVPNYTEAAYLADMPYKQSGASVGEFHAMIDRLRGLGAKSVVITSAVEEGSGAKLVAGYDHIKQEYFHLGFEEIPVRFPGTGDIFSAVFMGKILDGADAAKAAEAAMDTVKTMIIRNQDHADKYKGIPLEMCLEALDQ